ncbi:MAG: hypothetical protein A2252_01105 [Elusimicrobia bacterium RIFOXYA2_FULL_39_19]|nr:MAG: hypothetical protein A2252_01105 [Elusimicrobia bacterium RIFOXYA2_FULL_39_19]
MTGKAETFVITEFEENEIGGKFVSKAEDQDGKVFIGDNKHGVILSVSDDKKYVTNGKRSLKVIVAKDALWPAFYCSEKEGLPKDWSDYHFLEFDIINPGNMFGKLDIMVSGQNGTDMEKGYNYALGDGININPGLNQISIPLDGIVTQKDKQLINMKEIKTLFIYSSEEKLYQAGTEERVPEDMVFYLDNFRLEKVSSDSKKIKILINHLGYLTQGNKKVVISSGNFSVFELIDIGSNVVFTGSLNSAGTDLGSYLVGDFTNFTATGTYRIRVSTSEYSYCFPIGLVARDNYYDAVRKSAYNYFRKQRCGNTTINWRETTCHLDDAKLENRYGPYHNCAGGWHDACDLRKWMDATLYGIHGLESIKIINPSWDSNNAILDELKWGNLYFLNMQGPDGDMYSYLDGDPDPYSWADGSYWTDNIIGNDDDRVIILSTNPVRNYNFISAQANLYRIYKNTDSAYAKACLASAVRCYNFSKAQWPNLTGYSSCGYGIYAGVQLYLATGNSEYKNFAITMADNLMALQETKYIGGQTQIKGFFYTTAAKTAFMKPVYKEPMSLIGLCALCEVFPEDSKSSQWKECIRSYVEDYLSVIANRNAFGIVPYGLYSTNPGGSRQIGSLYYRYFMEPSLRWWVGMSSNLLGTAVGLGKASKILGKPQYLKLAERQLDWILGNNPFNATVVTGVGYYQIPFYDSHDIDQSTPLIDGGVMNGIGGTSTDMPYEGKGYWQTGEYWTPHVCYFLWSVSELLTVK